MKHHWTKLLLTLSSVLLLFSITGCQQIPEAQTVTQPTIPSKTFSLEHINTTRAKELLAVLNLKTSIDPNSQLITVQGTNEELHKAEVALDLIDNTVDYSIIPLGPAAIVRDLPTNEQIAHALGERLYLEASSSARERDLLLTGKDGEAGDIRRIVDGAGHRQTKKGPVEARSSLQIQPVVGTFIRPPRHTDMGILIDLYDDAVIAIAPQALTPKLQELVRHGIPIDPPRPIQLVEPIAEASESNIVAPTPEPTASTASKPSPPRKPIVIENKEVTPLPQRGILKPTLRSQPPVLVNLTTMELPDPNRVLELTLPDKLSLIQLLDLAGEYLQFTYIYDPQKVRDEVVTLKMHGKQQGLLTIQELYSLLETALKFKGLALVRQQDRIVHVVPANEALQSDPSLVDPNGGQLIPGDTVVTGIFHLRYVAADQVAPVIEGMQLSLSLNTMTESQTLLVTCYAHRMQRIADLIAMVDRPGEVREFRFRLLKYTLASTLTDKVMTLSAAMGAGNLTVSDNEPKPGKPGRTTATKTATVYLDTDDRTNRVLMIGSAEQLDLIEQLIDTLDVAQQDLRQMRIYEIRHSLATDVVSKLEDLGLLASSGQRSSTRTPGRGNSNDAREAIQEPLDENPQVVIIEETNQLLINATPEQHQRLEQVIDHVDVVAVEFRTTQVYDIHHISAEDTLTKLQDFGVLESSQNTERTRRGRITDPEDEFGIPGQETPPAVIVLEGTNQLLVKATELQHREIRNTLALMDHEAIDPVIPYEIYFLENQKPSDIAAVLERLVQASKDQEGKGESVYKDADDEVVIVPDEGTFSLVVYASRKNQDWIGKLIDALDRRRSQVLIDVTLVEVSKTDQFNYELDLISSIPDLSATSGLMEPIVGSVTAQSVLENLTGSNRSRFIEMQSSGGSANGFYGDKHIMLLLDAMQQKNYGRVLAKPKLLVNDNETGSIATTETTYVETSTQAVLSGNTEAITTSVTYEGYDAGITLNITPHISDGDLLRLEITLDRADFTATEGEAPPDTSGSNVNTVVTIPDGSTIILGGMLKLNQSKGASKVPLLGDLPLVGVLFRTAATSDIQKRLYVFVKAEIIRPDETLSGYRDMERISQQNRDAFEQHEREFQQEEAWPGVEPKITQPERVLEDR